MDKKNSILTISIVVILLVLSMVIILGYRLKKQNPEIISDFSPVPSATTHNTEETSKSSTDIVDNSVATPTPVAVEITSCIGDFEEFQYLPLNNTQLIDNMLPLAPWKEVVQDIPYLTEEGGQNTYDWALSRVNEDNNTEFWFLDAVPATESFDPVYAVYVLEKNEKYLVDAQNIREIHLTQNREIWAINRNAWVYSENDWIYFLSKYDEQNQEFEIIEIPFDVSYDEGKDQHITRFFDQDGNFWVFTEKDGVYRFNYEKLIYEKISESYSGEYPPLMNGQMYLIGETDDVFYFSLDDIFQPTVSYQMYIKSTGEFEEIPMPDFKVPRSDLFVDDGGNIWAGLIMILENGKNEWQYVTNNSEEYFNRIHSDNSVLRPTYLLETKDGKKWFSGFIGKSKVIGWYDDQTGDGCWDVMLYGEKFSKNNLIVGPEGDLYVIVNSNLYKYEINRE